MRLKSLTMAVFLALTAHASAENYGSKAVDLSAKAIVAEMECPIDSEKMLEIAGGAMMLVMMEFDVDKETAALLVLERTKKIRDHIKRKGSIAEFCRNIANDRW